ncbi:sterol desaturase family protein [Trinickia dinghuensis]|uniref:sterol desaturase family protein n=1 Tax=Trinickia dinghuensis TaxID=2291023 RepID=UPI001FE27F9C|nr:sterol desaturase family protein [Trinickia dinghuensis]
MSLPKMFDYVVGYVWPWNLFIMATTVLWWYFVVPDMATMKTIGWAWILKLLAANWIGNFLFYGFIELRYYRARVQERRFKYNGKFPAEQPSDVFLFRSQNIDNFLRSFFVSIPIGTAIEVGLLWAFANGLTPMVTWQAHPVYLIVLTLLAPIAHEVHFFFIHRAIHWGPLYKWVHSVHHNSVNPSPWSSMSMHPVESTLYFGVAFWVLAVPSHPFIAVYFFHLAAFGAVVGHIGFDRLEVTGDVAQPSHAYAHYLHHKYFEVNYCDNGFFPLDKWFGTWHDGSSEGDRRMQERFAKKKARLNVG